MAEVSKSPSFKQMLADGYEGPSTVYHGTESGMSAKMAVLRFLNGERIAIDTCEDCYAKIVGWVGKTAEFSQDDGSSRGGILVGLILMDGSFIQSTSKTIAETLDTFADVLGAPPYPAGMWVQIIKLVTRKKRKTDQLIPVEEKDIPEGAKMVTGKGIVPYVKPKK